MADREPESTGKLSRRRRKGESLSTNRVIKVTVNDRLYERLVEVRLTLADFLRQELDLTGTHLGCEHGVCGACTILFEGEAVRSCLMLAVQADGASLKTVESLATKTSYTRSKRLSKISMRSNADFARRDFS
jgi:aerobic-type carbon monoxide dehydrogenase small subunit (CoxS/CutS family)